MHTSRRGKICPASWMNAQKNPLLDRFSFKNPIIIKTSKISEFTDKTPARLHWFNKKQQERKTQSSVSQMCPEWSLVSKKTIQDLWRRKQTQSADRLPWSSSCLEEQLQANAKLAVCGSLSALTERLCLTSDQFEIKSQQLNPFLCQNYKSVSSSVECVFKSHINVCDRWQWPRKPTNQDQCGRLEAKHTHKQVKHTQDYTPPHTHTHCWLTTHKHTGDNLIFTLIRIQ